MYVKRGWRTFTFICTNQYFTLTLKKDQIIDITNIKKSFSSWIRLFPCIYIVAPRKVRLWSERYHYTSLCFLLLHTRTMALPVFSPLKRPINACAIFSKPFVTCSLYLNFPWNDINSIISRYVVFLDLSRLNAVNSLRLH